GLAVAQFPQVVPLEAAQILLALAGTLPVEDALEAGEVAGRPGVLGEDQVGGVGVTPADLLAPHGQLFLLLRSLLLLLGPLLLLLGTGLLLHGVVVGQPNLAALLDAVDPQPGHSGEATDQRQEQGDEQGGDCRATPRPLDGPLPGGAAPGLDRFASQPALQI